MSKLPKFIQILFVLALASVSLNAQRVKVAVFYGSNLQKVFIEAEKGKFSVVADGKKIATIKKSKTITLSRIGTKTRVSTLKKQLGDFNKVEFKPDKKATAFLTISPMSPKLAARNYAGTFTAQSVAGKLRFVSHVGIVPYLAGVVESETGTKRALEFYKAQSVICRTYTVGHMNRHAKEGFYLCDGVHCQAYKNRNKYDMHITKAVKATNDFVITYKDSSLTEAVFSANCGGITNNSEDVWKRAMPYLRSVVDTFCITEKQATWEKSISTEDWTKYVSEKVRKDLARIDTVAVAYSTDKREKYMPITLQIKVSDIRRDFKLRSAFISVIPDSTGVTFHGRGYGHGVGMCQEGAMRMGRLGFSYFEIIQFYYTDVLILSGNKLGYRPPR